MIPKSFVAACLLFFLINTLFAQDHGAERWGKVNAADLAMTTYPLDTSAEAAVLFDVGELELDLGTDKIRYLFTKSF